MKSVARGGMCVCVGGGGFCCTTRILTVQDLGIDGDTVGTTVRRQQLGHLGTACEGVVLALVGVERRLGSVGRGRVDKIIWGSMLGEPSPFRRRQLLVSRCEVMERRARVPLCRKQAGRSMKRVKRGRVGRG